MSKSLSFIDAKNKSIREILDNQHYEIDFYQREYRWQKIQIVQLIDDLTEKFLSNYTQYEKHEREEVKNYSKYYLGSIILNLKENKNTIIDGQQRLTSITLLLMYLNTLQKDKEDSDSVRTLIFSKIYGKKSFNLEIADREKCLQELQDNQSYDTVDENESIKNLVERYNDITDLFPIELTKEPLPYFIDWLIENVILVVIETYSDDDAYKIFETMNDRGLSLTATEMLKGFLLFNIKSDSEKLKINDLWKNNISKLKELKELDKNADLEFFQAWLRGKYAETFRQQRKGATDEDFEIIATNFHSWVKDNLEKIGLTEKISFSDFITKYFDFYSKQYIKIFNAANYFDQEFEHVYYVEDRGLAPTLYYPLFLAPLKLNDDVKVIDKKIQLVSRFLDTLILLKKSNYASIQHSYLKFQMYNLIKEIRDKSVDDLIKIFKKFIKNLDEKFDALDNYGLEKQNKGFMKFLLARITSHIEEKSGMSTSFEKYVKREKKNRFEIEHIWADKFIEHKDEFSEQSEFDEYRNSLGALILIPRGINQSYGADSYKKKLNYYFAENLLARSLDTKCYEKNPAFKRYIKESKLPFKPYEKFTKNSIEERQTLYRKICEEIWNINQFDELKD